jgi:hypothetical protein
MSVTISSTWKTVSVGAALMFGVFGSNVASANEIQSYTDVGDLKWNLTQDPAPNGFDGGPFTAAITSYTQQAGGPASLPSTLQVWCAELHQFIQPGQVNTSTWDLLKGASSVVGGLVALGEAAISIVGGGNGTLNSLLPPPPTWSTNEFAVDIQQAIWNLLEGDGFTAFGSKTATEMSNLATSLEGVVAPSAYFRIASRPDLSATCDAAATNECQDQLFTLSDSETPPVPGPILGAGLPGLVFACLGLLALARRRRHNFA